MLRKLFNRKPRLDADGPADRIAALAALGDDEQAAFARVFEEDDNLEVRLAALARLDRAEPIWKAVDDSAVGQQALARLLAVMDDDTPGSIRHHPVVVRAVLSRAETPEQALRLAADLPDHAVFAEALLESPRANIRLAVTQEIWNPELLTELEKSSRGRDKSMHRVARDRLVSLRAATGRRSDEDDQTEALLAVAIALADDDPHYDAKRNAVERDWDHHLEVLHATDEELGRFGVVARDVNATRGRFPARRVQPTTPDVEEFDTDFEALLGEAATLADTVVEGIAHGLDEDTVQRHKQSVDDLANRWNAGADVKPPSAELSERFREAMTEVAKRHGALDRAVALAERTRTLLEHPVPSPEGSDTHNIDAVLRRINRQIADIDRLLGEYDWPETLPGLPELDALGQRKGDLADAAGRCQEQATTLTEEIGALVGELKKSIEDGAVHDAVERDRKLRDLVKSLPRDAARAFDAELAELGAKVRELKDWRTYAQAPQREALCTQVEEIADNPLNPHEQMRLVKSLRAEWNALGPVDTRRDRELKRRFDRAAERAFEPCRLFFKEQAERRAFNLEQRQAIVAALEGFLTNNDWDHADWRGVERILRQARAEWRSYHPVDRKSGSPVAERFEELAGRIHQNLKEEWERNIAAKEAIVAEAIEVRESQARVTDQAESMKALQRRWKAVGPLPRRADQRLWKQFREQCDQVFEARTVVHDRHTQRRQTIADAEALLTELERRVEIDPSLDRNMIADYERRIHDLGDVPKEFERRAEEILRDADRIVVQRQTDASGG